MRPPRRPDPTSDHSPAARRALSTIAGGLRQSGVDSSMRSTGPSRTRRQPAHRRGEEQTGDHRRHPGEHQRRRLPARDPEQQADDHVRVEEAQGIHEAQGGTAAILGAPAGVAAEQHLEHRHRLRDHQDRRDQDGEDRLRHDAESGAHRAEGLARVACALDLEQKPRAFGMSTISIVAKNSRNAAPGSTTGHTGNSVRLSMK